MYCGLGALTWVTNFLMRRDTYQYFCPLLRRNRNSKQRELQKHKVFNDIGCCSCGEENELWELCSSGFKPHLCYTPVMKP